MATAGLSLWSTTAATNANSDPTIGMAEGMAPSAVNDGIRALMATIAKWRDDFQGITAGLSTGGTSTAFTVTSNATFATASAMSGAIFSIIPHTTSGAAPTLAVDSLTARALNFSTGVAIPTGALISGTPYLVRYKHATTEFIVIGPSVAVLTALDIIGGTQLTAPANNDTLPIYDLSATANKRILLSDFFLVINDFTADASPDSSADYVVTYDASAAASKKVLLGNLPSSLPRGYNSGGILSNGTDTTNDINITAGKWRDSTDVADIVVSANTSGKQLDANWAASGTTNSGMRNSAVGIANGTYHLYAARTAASSTATIYAYAGVAGTDPDSAAAISTMLAALQAESGGSSYAYARRIGSIVRAGAAILQFNQVGDAFTLKTAVTDISVALIGDTNAHTATLGSVPLGVKMNARLGVANGNTNIVWLSDPDCNDQAPSATTFPVVGNGTAVGTAYVEVFTNTSAQIRYRSNVNSSIYVATIGWRDNRGRDA